MFEGKRERDGKGQVPVFFTVNGKKIIVQDEDENEDENRVKDEDERSHFYLDCGNPLFPYVCLTEGCSVLAKVRTLPEVCSL